MPATYITTVDPTGNYPLPVIPDSNVLWSSGNKKWGGLTIERHKFDSLDTPEFVIPDHSLIIQLSSPVTVESKVNGSYKSQVSGAGNICILSAGAKRQFCVRQPVEVLLITLSQNAVNRVVRESKNRLSPELIEHRQLRDPQIEHIGLALKAEVETGYTSGEIYGKSLCLALTSHLLARYSAAKVSIPEQKGGMSPHSLRLVLKYIHENLAEDLTINKLAEIAGLSYYRFSHNFKQATGVAPYHYIINERIKRAEHLLLETDLTIIDIAGAVGCDNPSRFSLLFHRQTGVTPSVYRATR